MRRTAMAWASMALAVIMGGVYCYHDAETSAPLLLRPGRGSPSLSGLTFLQMNCMLGAQMILHAGSVPPLVKWKHCKIFRIIVSHEIQAIFRVLLPRHHGGSQVCVWRHWGIDQWNHQAHKPGILRNRITGNRFEKRTGFRFPHWSVAEVQKVALTE